MDGYLLHPLIAFGLPQVCSPNQLSLTIYVSRKEYAYQNEYGLVNSHWHNEVSTSNWRKVSISSKCLCLRATICFFNWENSNFMISSHSPIVASLTPSSKSLSLNLSVEIATDATGDKTSALGKRGYMSFTAIIASTHMALSSLLSALKCSLFFVPVHTENLLLSDLFSRTEHTYKCITWKTNRQLLNHWRINFTSVSRTPTTRSQKLNSLNKRMNNF